MDIGYSFGQMIWIVLVYSFLGWCCEVAFAAVRRGIFDEDSLYIIGDYDKKIFCKNN